MFHKRLVPVMVLIHLRRLFLLAAALIVLFVLQLLYLDYALSKKLAQLEQAQKRNLKAFKQVQNSAREARLQLYQPREPQWILAEGSPASKKFIAQ